MNILLKILIVGTFLCVLNGFQKKANNNFHFFTTLNSTLQNLIWEMFEFIFNPSILKKGTVDIECHLKYYSDATLQTFL